MKKRRLPLFRLFVFSTLSLALALLSVTVLRPHPPAAQWAHLSPGHSMSGVPIGRLFAP